MALDAAYRMTRRAIAPAEESGACLGVLPTASVVAVETAGTWAAEQAEEKAEEKSDAAS